MRNTKNQPTEEERDGYLFVFFTGHEQDPDDEQVYLALFWDWYK